MTSFGAQIENPDQFMSTFKVKGQIYHREGPFYHSQARIINFYNCTSSVIEILN